MANLEYYNKRIRIKRSTVSGVIPTVPTIVSGAVDVNDHTKGGWLATDLYVGELYINTADDLAWIRFDSGIVQLDTASGYGSFLNLTDTPGAYTGQASKLLQVNASENGVEFVTNSNLTEIIELTDTPSVITAGYTLVGDSGSYVEKIYVDEFDKLSDIDNYSGNALKYYRINITEDALEAIDLNTQFVSLSTIQTIAGDKTFSDDITIDGTLTLNTSFNLNGNDITSIITDTDLIGASDNNLPSTLAVKTYIDSQVITAVGGDYVARTGAVTIEDTKTFQDDTIFDSDITVSGTSKTETIEQSISSYHYFGDVNTNGSYRFFINPDGNLEIQKRESGVWVYKANF